MIFVFKAAIQLQEGKRRYQTVLDTSSKNLSAYLPTFCVSLATPLRISLAHLSTDLKPTSISLRVL